MITAVTIRVWNHISDEWAYVVGHIAAAGPIPDNDDWSRERDLGCLSIILFVQPPFIGAEDDSMFATKATVEDIANALDARRVSS